MTRSLRLGFVSARSAYRGAGLVTEAGIARLIDTWRKTHQVTVALSLAPERQPLHDHELALHEDDFLPMPWLPSVARGFHKALACRRVIREVERRSDVVIVQLPFAAPLALVGPTRPRIYHLCHDLRTAVLTSIYYRGAKRIPAVIAAEAIDRLYHSLVHSPRTRVVANGGELLAHYGHPRGRAVVSATISETEISSVARARPEKAPFRILYVGYLRHEKGIDVLLTAFDRLLDDLPAAELFIVGARNPEDRGMSAALDAALVTLGSKGRVTSIGHLPYGPELFRCFADADVLALPSRAEGTPRVLVEARAFRCPVVATRVGGVPSSVTDGVDGLLVPPDDPRALAAALLRVAREPGLHGRLVDGGLRRVSDLTVEAFARSIAEETTTLLADT